MQGIVREERMIWCVWVNWSEAIGVLIYSFYFMGFFQVKWWKIYDISIFFIFLKILLEDGVFKVGSVLEGFSSKHVLEMGIKYDLNVAMMISHSVFVRLSVF